MPSGGGPPPTNISWNGPYRSVRSPINWRRFALPRQRRGEMKTPNYLRVSTRRQAEAQTIEQQLVRLRKHVELQGEALSADNIFRDDGYSGANLNRPGLD